MLGTVLNSISIILGSFIGVFFGSKFSGSLRDTFYAILGTFAIFMGIGMFLESENAIVCLTSLFLGTFIGEVTRLEEKVESAGARVIAFSARFYGATRQEESDRQRMIKGFVTASLFFVTGPIGILGAFQSGLSGDLDLLMMKSLLDGITAIVFASVMGIGVAFSALAGLVYQGFLTLFSRPFHAFLSDAMISEMTGTGGILLGMIGISSLLGLKKICASSAIPAIFLAPLMMWFVERFA